MFVDNKYRRLYNAIIENAKEQDRKKTRNGTYYERHHILPKSLGGDDSEENLVLLTAREHYLAHYLLTKFTTGPGLHSVACAWRMMNTDKRKKKSRYVNSRLYEHSKELVREAISAINTGRNVGKKSAFYKHEVHVFYNHVTDKYFKCTQGELSRYGIGSSEAVRIMNGLMSKNVMLVTKDRPKPRPFKQKGYHNPATDKNVYTFIHPEHGEHKTLRMTLMSMFPDHKLTVQGLTDMIKGRTKSHRGWRVLK